MNIKRILASITIAAALAFTAGAQTVTTNQSGGTTTLIGPINEIETWTTSFNTNLLESASKFDLSTGTREITGATGVGNVMSFRYYIDTNYVVGIVGGFGAAGTAFNSVEGEFAYRFYSHYDFALDGGVLAGYDGLNRALEVEPELVAEKEMTSISALRLRLTHPVESVGKGNGNVGVFAEIVVKFP